MDNDASQRVFNIPREALKFFLVNTVSKIAKGFAPFSRIPKGQGFFQDLLVKKTHRDP